jgi:MFS family permease
LAEPESTTTKSACDAPSQTSDAVTHAAPGLADLLADPKMRMLAAVIGLTFVMNMIGRGATETFAVFLLPVEKEFEASRSSVAAIYSLYILVLGSTGPFVGQIVDRLGIRASYGLGVICLASSYILAGLATFLWQIKLSIGLLSGLGASCLGMVVASSLLSRWFSSRMGAVMSVPYAAVGLGVLALPPFTQLMLDWYGWRAAYRILGLAILSLLPLILLLPLKRMEAGSDEWQRLRRQSASSAAPTWTLKRAVRTGAFWGMVAAYFFTSVASFCVAPHMVAYLIESGFPPIVAASAYGGAGALAAAGIVAMGALSDRIGRAGAATVSYLSTILGIALLLSVTWWPSMILVYGYVLFFGGMQGARGPIILAMIATLYRGGNVGTIFGATTLGMGTGGAFGSWFSGLLHDATGSYTASFLVGISAAFAGMACFWLIPSIRHERLEGKVGPSM